MSAAGEAMRDELIGRLYSRLKDAPVTVAAVAAAVDVAIEASGYEALAALASQSTAVQILVGAEVATPSTELADALAALETDRAAVAGHPINGVLVEIP